MDLVAVLFVLRQRDVVFIKYDSQREKAIGCKRGIYRIGRSVSFSVFVVVYKFLQSIGMEVLLQPVNELGWCIL